MILERYDLLQSVALNRTLTTVPHGLSYTPTHVIPAAPVYGVVIWSSQPPDATNLYLRASAPVTATLMIQKWIAGVGGGNPNRIVIPASLSDGVTDVSPVLQAAIRSLSANRGGTIEIPYGTSFYRLGSMVTVDRPVTIIGQGGFFGSDPGTELRCDAGVSGFYCTKTTGINDGSDNSVIQNLVITSANIGSSTSVDCSMTAGFPNTVDLASPGDFSDGDHVRIGGCGQSWAMASLFVTVLAGDTVINLATCGLHVGMWIMVPGAWDDPVEIVAVTSTTITVARTASGGVTNIQVRYVASIIGIITAGGGTTTLTLDVSVSGVNQTFNPAGKCTHAESAIIVRNPMTVRDVTFGGAVLSTAKSFRGPAVSINASHGYTPTSNANCWRLENIFVSGCMNALRVEGVDANAGLGDQIVSVSTRDWSIEDCSFLGNTYIAPHASGAGIITLHGGNTRTTIIGPYHESGAIPNLGSRTVAVGGTFDPTRGGIVCDPSGWNRMTIGLPTDDHVTDWDPGLGFEHWNFEIRHRVSSVALDGLDGFHVYEASSGVSHAYALAIQTAASGLLSKGKGSLWLPKGFYLGKATNDLDVSKARLVDVGDAAPASGTFTAGDLVLARAPTIAGNIGGKYIVHGWRCTTSGSPGTWKEIRAFTEDGVARLYLGGTALVAGDFALSAGWGDTASVGTITGADARCKFTVTSAGVGQAANPTITLTFKDGTWTVTPFVVACRGGGSQLGIQPCVTGVTATTVTLTWPGTPVAAETFQFILQAVG